MDLFRNRATDCGNNTLGTDGYRAGITLAGVINDSAAEHNTVVDTGSPNAKGKVFFQNLVVTGGVLERGNVMRLTSTLTSLSSAFSTASGEEQVIATLVGGSMSLDTRRADRWDLTCNGPPPTSRSRRSGATSTARSCASTSSTPAAGRGRPSPGLP
jgi:hypothetical protein